MIIDDLFFIHNAKSKGFIDYKKGQVAFVTNGFMNNGIIGHVEPKKGDRVFNFKGICISAFCEATVHEGLFLPRGNGGSGLTVLEPKEELSYNELVQIAAYLNVSHRWKFSYGRMAIQDRIRNLEIKLDKRIRPKKQINDLIPKKNTKENIYKTPQFKRFNITELFNLERGDFHALDRLKIGKIPTVSRVTYDNGIVGFYQKPINANIYSRGTITVSTTSGDAFVQTDDFISTDNVVILLPKKQFSIEEIFFISMMINKEKWRVSYGRQCYKTIFAKTNIFLPIDKNDEINQEYMKNLVEDTSYWAHIREHFN